MSLREALLVALRGLRSNRLRSVLTMLGIIIGVASVIVLVAIGNGAQQSVNKKIQPLANLLTIVQTDGTVPGGADPKDLTDTDAKTLDEQVPSAVNVLPITKTATLAETESGEWRSNVYGSDPRWLGVQNRELGTGRFYTDADVRSNAKVAVLGSSVASQLFGDSTAALGRDVRINRQTFKVIGVLKPFGEPGDNDVVMPLDNARRYIRGGSDEIDQIVMQAAVLDAVPAMEADAIRILNQRHRIYDPAKRDFEVQSLRGRLSTLTDILRILTLFTAAVAAISLVVGGIGVLNIMLVSVTERTREIGIRKAIGATHRAILQQFLIEAIVLAGLGGVLGVLIGVGLAFLGAVVAPSLDPSLATFTPDVTAGPAVIAFGISLAIGLIAGGYPANRAARLRPVEALRYE